MFMSTSDNELIGRSPRALTGVSARGLENWRSTPEEREKCEKTAKNPFIAAKTTTAESRVPIPVARLDCPRRSSKGKKDEFLLRKFEFFWASVDRGPRWTGRKEWAI